MKSLHLILSLPEAASLQGRARRSGLWLVLAMVLAGGIAACAQSNGVPGPEEYTGFSKFITDRNIFDPNRQPHNYDSRRTYSRPRTRTRATPGIRFVGTMSYEKGMFAFFSGSSADLSKVAQVGDKVSGYTVTAITATSVSLESIDKKTQEMNVGDGLTEENGKWVFSKSGELPIASTAADTGGSASSDGTSAPAAVPAAIEGNDILKRLMQQRQKENQ